MRLEYISSMRWLPCDLTFANLLQENTERTVLQFHILQVFNCYRPYISKHYKMLFGNRETCQSLI